MDSSSSSTHGHSAGGGAPKRGGPRGRKGGKGKGGGKERGGVAAGRTEPGTKVIKPERVWQHVALVRHHVLRAEVREPAFRWRHLGDVVAAVCDNVDAVLALERGGHPRKLRHPDNKHVCRREDRDVPGQAGGVAVPGDA